MVIHDPNVDAMFRNGQAPPQALEVAAPMKDFQIICLMASQIYQVAGMPSDDRAKLAAEIAMRTFAEVVALFPKGNQYIQEARERLESAKKEITQ